MAITQAPSTGTPPRRLVVAGRLGPTARRRRRLELELRADELVEKIRVGGPDTAANIDALVQVRRSLESEAWRCA